MPEATWCISVHGPHLRLSGGGPGGRLGDRLSPAGLAEHLDDATGPFAARRGIAADVRIAGGTASWPAG